MREQLMRQTEHQTGDLHLLIVGSKKLIDDVHKLGSPRKLL